MNAENMRLPFPGMFVYCIQYANPFSHADDQCELFGFPLRQPSAVCWSHPDFSLIL